MQLTVVYVPAKNTAGVGLESAAAAATTPAGVGATAAARSKRLRDPVTRPQEPDVFRWPFRWAALGVRGGGGGVRGERLRHGRLSRSPPEQHLPSGVRLLQGCRTWDLSSQDLKREAGEGEEK